MTKIGIIGGSGVYGFEKLTDTKTKFVDTPFGEPSGEILSGKLGSTEVYFVPRHGKDHHLIPSEVNYRANLFALKSLGVQWCIGVSAVGSLQEEFHPGDFAIPNQLIDRTRLRENTFFGNGVVAHIGFGDPYCDKLRSILIEEGKGLRSGPKIHDTATYVCMEGPAFSTRAESELYRSWGAQLIGMTALPEAKLAREAEISYATLALVTDYDCWKAGEEDVGVEGVVATVRKNVHNAKELLERVAIRLGSETQPETTASALAGAFMSKLQQLPAEKAEAMRPLIGKYLPTE